jgi:hypothetical protein
MAAVSPELSPIVLNTNADILAKTKVLGQGSWGTIFNSALDNKNNTGTIQEFPNHVMKIMIPTDRNKPSNKLKQTRKEIINQFMSNNNGRHTYKYTRKFTPKNFNALKTKINNSELKKAIENKKNINLNVYHMPNLGVSLNTALSAIRVGLKREYVNMIKPENINTIVKQLCKLLRQIHRLVELEWIHGDIHVNNIMIDPTSFVFTLIDFDWLYSMEEFPIKYRHAFGFYINPPEVFVAYQNDMKINLIKHIIKDIINQYKITPDSTSTSDTIIIKSEKTKSGYTFHFTDVSYNNLMANLENLNTLILTEQLPIDGNIIQYFNITFLNDLIKKYNNYVLYNNYYYKKFNRQIELNKIINRLINKLVDDKTITSMREKHMQTYDSYCISSCFLELLYTMYPNMIDKEEDPIDVFTPIFKMIHEVLLPLADLNWEKRAHINDVIGKINEIEAQIAPASVPVPGGSRTYKKRKIRKHQRTYKK